MLRRSALLVTAAALLALARPGTAQEPSASNAGRVPEADPADVTSLDAIIGAGYEAISGAAGEERDWDRFRSLVVPDARLTWTGRVDGAPVRRALGVEGFIAMARETFQQVDMYEEPIHTVTERFGDIAHVFVTDASRRSPGAEPYERGINSFQLWHDGERWWVLSVVLHTEREGAPIPERYGG